MRRYLTMIIIGIICSLCLPSMVSKARDVHQGERCVIPADETITGTLFTFCEDLIIHGKVTGDVIGIAYRAVIDGVIDGSLYVVGGQLDITGIVRQNIHYGGAVLRINPPQAEAETPPPVRIIGAVKAVTLSSVFYEQTQIEQGVINVGYQMFAYGDIHDEVSFWGSALVIDGDIAGNVYAIVGDPDADSAQIETLLLPLNLDIALRNPGLVVAEGSDIQGLLSYRGPKAGQIAADLRFVPNYQPTARLVPTLDESRTWNIYFSLLGREFATLLIIGSAILLFANQFLAMPLGNLRTRPFASMGVGLLTFLLSFPIMLIIMIITFALLGFLFFLGLREIVLILGLVLSLVNVGSASLFYLLAIFVARALVCIAIGRLGLRLLLKRNNIDQARWSQFLALLIGVTAVSVTIALPIVGILFNAMALFLGLGALMIVAMSQFKRFRETSPRIDTQAVMPSPLIRDRQLTLQSNPPSDALVSPLTVAMPAPPPEEPPAPIGNDDETVIPVRQYGADNLPEGFDFSFFDD